MTKPYFGLTLALALSALTGCMTPDTVWTKQGGTPDELRYVREDCASQAAGYRFVDEARYDGLERDRGASAQGDVYRQCMEMHGWHRQRASQAPK